MVGDSDCQSSTTGSHHSKQNDDELVPKDEAFASPDKGNLPRATASVSSSPTKKIIIRKPVKVDKNGKITSDGIPFELSSSSYASLSSARLSSSTTASGSSSSPNKKKIIVVRKKSGTTDDIRNNILNSDESSPPGKRIIVRKKVVQKAPVQPPKSPFRQMGDGVLKLIKTPIKKMKPVFKLPLDNVSDELDNNDLSDSHSNSPTTATSDDIIRKTKPSISTGKFANALINMEEQQQRKGPPSSLLITPKKRQGKKKVVDKTQQAIEMMEKKVDRIDLLAQQIRNEINKLETDIMIKKNEILDKGLLAESVLTTDTASKESNDNEENSILYDVNHKMKVNDNHIVDDMEEQIQYLRNKLLLITKMQKEFSSLEAKVDREIITEASDINHAMKTILQSFKEMNDDHHHDDNNDGHNHPLTPPHHDKKPKKRSSSSINIHDIEILLNEITIHEDDDDDDDDDEHVERRRSYSDDGLIETIARQNMNRTSTTGR